MDDKNDNWFPVVDENGNPLPAITSDKIELESCVMLPSDAVTITDWTIFVPET